MENYIVYKQKEYLKERRFRQISNYPIIETLFDFIYFNNNTGFNGITFDKRLKVTVVSYDSIWDYYMDKFNTKDIAYIVKYSVLEEYRLISSRVFYNYQI